MLMQYLGGACTWGGESLMESSHRLGEPGQDIRVVRDQAPNDTLNDIVLTYGYAEGLRNAPMEVWGGEERQRGGGCYKASCCHAWAVDCTTSISEAHTVSG